MSPYRATLLAVAVGGAAGAAARYGVDLCVPDGALTWATLGINVVGALLLGMVMGAPLRRLPGGSVGRSLLGTGFCGGFTTFSTLAVQVAQRSDAHPNATLVYLILSLVLAGPAVALGRRLVADRAVKVVADRHRPPAEKTPTDGASTDGAPTDGAPS